MTNADKIRQMSDDELVELLEWRTVNCISIPECDEGCEWFSSGCAGSCPTERRERAIREWIHRDEN